MSDKKPRPTPRIYNDVAFPFLGGDSDIDPELEKRLELNHHQEHNELPDKRDPHISTQP